MPRSINLSIAPPHISSLTKKPFGTLSSTKATCDLRPDTASAGFHPPCSPRPVVKKKNAEKTKKNSKNPWLCLRWIMIYHEYNPFKKKTYKQNKRNKKNAKVYSPRKLPEIFNELGMMNLLCSSWNPNNPCFGWKRPSTLEAKQRTHGFQVCFGGGEPKISAGHPFLRGQPFFLLVAEGQRFFRPPFQWRRKKKYNKKHQKVAS